MRTNNLNKTTAQALSQKAIEGVDKHFAKGKTMTIAGTDYTPATLKAVLQADIDATKVVEASQAQLKEQQATAAAAQAKASTMRKELKAHVLSTYGAQAVAMLGDFGMQAPKAPGPKTTAAKAKAAAQAVATRKARNPYTKAEKMAIKGIVAERPAQAATQAPAVQQPQAVTPAAATVAASSAPTHS
jgi:hypothetical protein